MINQKKGINTKTEFIDFGYIYIITDFQDTDVNLTHDPPMKTALFSVSIIISALLLCINNNSEWLLLDQ